MNSVDSRVEQGPPTNRMRTSDRVHDDDQDLGGYEEELGAEDRKAAALDSHTMLNALASQLADFYGERPSVRNGPRREDLVQTIICDA
jgi:hypothetical protein